MSLPPERIARARTPALFDWLVMPVACHDGAVGPFHVKHLKGDTVAALPDTIHECSEAEAQLRPHVRQVFARQRFDFQYVHQDQNRGPQIE